MSSSENVFGNEDKQFDTVDEYLDRLKSDLQEDGYDVGWGSRIETENGKRAVEVIYEGNLLEDIRVPINLDVINKQMGPLTGYEMMLDTVKSTLYYDQNEGDIPSLNQQ